MNTYLRKIKKNSKALSPVIASIILIAVTVAVSVVVAAWMGGMSLGFMNNAEQATITNVQFTDTDTIVVTVMNSGTSSITLQAATIDGSTATLAAQAPTTSLVIAKGHSETFSVVKAADFDSGTQYMLKMTTAKGTGLVYTLTAP